MHHITNPVQYLWRMREVTNRWNKGVAINEKWKKNIQDIEIQRLLVASEDEIYGNRTVKKNGKNKWKIWHQNNASKSKILIVDRANEKRLTIWQKD